MKRLALALIATLLTGCATIGSHTTENEFVLDQIEKERCEYAALLIENHYQLDANVHLLKRWSPSASNSKLLTSLLPAYSGRKLACIDPYDAKEGRLMFRVHFIGLGRDIFIMDHMPMLREGEVMKVVIPTQINFSFYADAPLEFYPVILDTQ